MLCVNYILFITKLSYRLFFFESTFYYLHAPRVPRTLVSNCLRSTPTQTFISCATLGKLLGSPKFVFPFSLIIKVLNSFADRIKHGCKYK